MFPTVGTGGETVLVELGEAIPYISEKFTTEFPKCGDEDLALEGKDHICVGDAVETQRRSSGFHTAPFEKSPLRNISRTCGLFEQMWRNSQPP